MKKGVGSSRRWHHRSVLALVRSTGGGDPEEIVRTKAKEKVAWAKSLGWVGPPYDPFLLASLCGIKHRPNPGLLSAEAQLTPQPGRQLLLEFNPERADVRRNFSICHEIAHTFFDDCYEVVSQRKSNPTTYGPQSEVEQLCQIGAAELLMPEEDFLQDLQRLDFSMCSVPCLSGRYVASREAVLRRMVQLGGRPAALVFLSRRLAPSQRRDKQQRTFIPDLDEPAPKMRILYVVPSADFPVFLPPHKSVPDTSCVYATSDIDEIAVQDETWNIDGFREWCVEAMTLPVPIDADDDTPTVAALVLP